MSLVGPKSRCLEGLGENPFLCLFQFQEAAHIPQFMAPFPLFHSWQHCISLTTLPSSYFPLLPQLEKVLHFYGPMRLDWADLRNSGLSSHLKALSLITSAESFLPYRVLSQTLGIRAWTSLGRGWGGPSFGLPQLWKLCQHRSISMPPFLETGVQVMSSIFLEGNITRSILASAQYQQFSTHDYRSQHHTFSLPSFKCL